jgi:acetyltransferase EpsM
MKQHKEHFIFGAGGHGKVIAELIQGNNCSVEAFIDDYPKVDLMNSIPVISSHFLNTTDIKLSVIIAVGDNLTRKDISKRLSNHFFFSCYHKNAILSPSITIGEGTVVMSNCVINSNVNIGKHVIINTASIVEHDCNIESFVHISPRATLLGAVTVGEGTQIGSGVIVLPGITIGKWCVIGAGSVILNDVPDGSIVVGNPGKIIKENPIYYSAIERESSAVYFG